LKVIFEKSTKSFDRYRILSKEGIRGSIYFPRGMQLDNVSFQVVPFDHPEHAQGLDDLENQEHPR